MAHSSLPGRPKEGPRPQAPLADRFWAKVTKGPGCWLWTGCTSRGGYGYLSRGGRGGGNERAHRISWEINYGPIPAGQIVLHRCDTPSCVRPDHLRLGTQADNVADMIEKGRGKPWGPGNQSSQRGETHWKAKLTDEQVAEIRSLRGKMSQKAIGLRFGISQAHVSRLFRGDSRKVV